MSYNNNMPEFMADRVIKIVNKRFDITQDQFNQLVEIDKHLKIPPSAIVRVALNCFLPKIKNDNFTYEGISNLWNHSKF